MTAAVEVDDPLVEQIARQIAAKAAEPWGLDGDHPWIAAEADKLLPAVRATIAGLKDGKVREVLEDSPALGRLGAPRLGPGWWIERHIVWETTPARPEATT